MYSYLFFSLQKQCDCSLSVEVPSPFTEDAVIPSLGKGQCLQQMALETDAISQG